MFGNLTRVGSNYHAEEAWNNLKALNGKIGQVQSRLSTGKRAMYGGDAAGQAMANEIKSKGLSGLSNDSKLNAQSGICMYLSSVISCL